MKKKSFSTASDDERNGGYFVTSERNKESRELIGWRGKSGKKWAWCKRQVKESTCICHTDLALTLKPLHRSSWNDTLFTNPSATPVAYAVQMFLPCDEATFQTSLHVLLSPPPFSPVLWRGIDSHLFRSLEIPGLRMELIDLRLNRMAETDQAISNKGVLNGDVK